MNDKPQLDDRGRRRIAYQRRKAAGQSLRKTLAEIDDLQREIAGQMNGLDALHKSLVVRLDRTCRDLARLFTDDPSEKD